MNAINVNFLLANLVIKIELFFGIVISF